MLGASKARQGSPLQCSACQEVLLQTGALRVAVVHWAGHPAGHGRGGGSPVLLLKLFPYYGDVYNIAWSGLQSNWLLAGTAAGLVGWNVESDKVKAEGSKYRPMMVDFLLPVLDKDNGENPIVDSLAVAGEWSIAAK